MNKSRPAASHGYCLGFLADDKDPAFRVAARLRAASKRWRKGGSLVVWVGRASSGCPPFSRPTRTLARMKRHLRKGDGGQPAVRPARAAVAAGRNIPCKPTTRATLTALGSDMAQPTSSHLPTRADLYMASITATRAAASLGLTNGWSGLPSTAFTNWSIGSGGAAGSCVTGLSSL